MMIYTDADFAKATKLEKCEMARKIIKGEAVYIELEGAHEVAQLGEKMETVGLT
jgi:hypothetical protein